MNTPNNAAALTYMGRQLTAQEAVTMFANQEATIRSLRDELAALRATLAQPDAFTSSVDMEAAAKAVYDAMPYDGRSETGSKPAWVPGGNSIRQVEARSFARAAISALTGLRGGGEAEAKRGAMVQMLMAASEDIDEMAKRTGASRFPSVEQLRGWRRMVDSILAAVQTLPFTPSALTSQPSGEAVAWLITWNDGRKSVSFDKCHADDGTCVPLTHPSADAPGAPVQACKHKWRDSDRADPMLPCAWVQQCTKCGAYEDDN